MAPPSRGHFPHDPHTRAGDRDCIPVDFHAPVPDDDLLGTGDDESVGDSHSAERAVRAGFTHGHMSIMPRQSPTRTVTAKPVHLRRLPSPSDAAIARCSAAEGSALIAAALITLVGAVLGGAAGMR